MTSFFFTLLRPDFIQIMLLATVVLMLPLKKRPLWGLRLVGAAAPFLLAEVLISVNTASSGWEEPFVGLYYILPILIVLAVLGACTVSSLSAVLYETGCVYAAQHIAFCAVTIIWGEHGGNGFSAYPLYQELGEWGINLIVLALFYWFVAKRLPTEGRYQVSPQKGVFTFGLVLLIALVLSYISRQVWESADPTIYAICLTYDLFSCLFILLLQLEQRREAGLLAMVETERRLRQQMKLQYELSKENIDIINRKSHDLRHQISALRLVSSPAEREASLREIERSVLLYDTSAQTGNEVLDTVLTEKGLICQENNISWTYMADGRSLGFISTVDLYTLLGNALDNAIESSKSIAQPERRVVRVTVQQTHGAVFLQVENYYDHPIQMVQGVPQTTKKDVENHGFGLKSIRVITERYGGTMDIELGNGTFLLTILIPIP
jgi:hypothetical protein